MSKQTKKKSSNPVKVVVIWTVILAVIAVGSMVAGNAIDNHRQSILKAKQDEVQEINDQRRADYNAALAEYREATAADQSEDAWPVPAGEGWDVVDLSDYSLKSKGSVTVSRADVMHGGLLLVNQWHSRPDDFDEEVLVSIGQNAQDKVGVQNYSQELHPDAIAALVAAMTDANALGLKGYVIDDAYRSWDDQNALFQSKLQQLSSRYEGDALVERAKKEVNYPGTSEFNTGLSFTLYLYERNNTELNNTPFSTSQQGTWLYDNAWRYGLVFRFPKADFPLPGVMDKSYKTGVSVSLNCYRYVGKAHAAVMKHLDLCLEEYIEYLQEKPHIAVYEDGVLKYEIVRQEVGTAQSSSVDITRQTQTYTMSLDNMGGVITAFEYSIE